MHMTTFSNANGNEPYSSYDNRNKPPPLPPVDNGKIYYLSTQQTNDLNQVDHNATYHLSRIDRYGTSCASTSRLVNNNYEIIGNESLYNANNYSSPSEYGPNSDDTYLQAKTTEPGEKNRIGISVLRVSAGDSNNENNSGYLSTSTMTTNEECAKKRIRLGNDNYVISIQPFNGRKSVVDLNESETDNTTEPVSSPNLQTGYRKMNNRPAVKGGNTVIVKHSSASFLCGCCSCFFKLFTFFLRICQCLGSCFCTPCCFATALFGGVAAALGVVALGFFGIIPIPVNWANTICNATDNQRNIYVTYENVTIIDRPFQTTLLVTKAPGDSQFTTVNTTTSADPMNQARLERYRAEQAEINNQLKSTTTCKAGIKTLNFQWIPLYYHILLLPNFSTFNLNNVDLDDNANSNNQKSDDLEMKINLDIQIYCNQTTNILQLRTREFTNINLTIENNEDSTLRIINWNFDKKLSLLNIMMNKDCLLKSKYKLSIFIMYKSYGKVKNTANFFHASFDSKNSMPFPYVTDSNNRVLATNSAPCLFNITTVNVRSTLMTISNMETENSYETDGLQVTRFKLTPFTRIENVAILIGKFICKDTVFFEQDKQFKMRLCSLTQLNDQIEKVMSYAGSIIEFFKNYTKRPFDVDKIDIVVLPVNDISEYTNTDNPYDHNGILYLPLNLLTQINDQDQLIRSQIKSKIIYTLAKQLSRYWFNHYRFTDCSCSIWSHGATSRMSTNSNPFVTIERLFADKYENRTLECNDVNCLNDKRSKDLEENTVLDYNIECFLRKGIIGWLSYMSLQSIQSDLYDLIELEWYMFRRIEVTSLTMYQNDNYFSNDFDFVKLTDNNNFLRSKIELKSIIFARTLYIMFGSQKFQMIINKLFKPEGSIFINTDNINELFRKTKLDQYYSIKLLNNPQEDANAVDIFEFISKQYNVLQNQTVRNLILSWLISDNNVVMKIERNYNKRVAITGLDISNTQSGSTQYSYPFYWFDGSMKPVTIETFSDFSANSDLTLKSDFNMKLLQKSIDGLTNLPGADKWFIGNYMRAFGLFRINYDLQNWYLIIEQLLKNPNVLTIYDRNQLMDDVFYLSNNGKLSIGVTLNILEYLPIESSYLPWKFAIDNIKSLISYIQDDSSVYANFRQFIIELMESTYRRLKWGENYMDTMDDKLIRILVVDLMCHLDYEDCVDNSVKQLSDSIKINVNNIPQHLSKSVFCTAIRYTGINEWNYLWSLFVKQTSTNSKTSNSLLQSLSCSSHIWILNLFLQKLVYENYIPRNELPTAFEYLSQNPVGKYIVWNHISQNYQEFFNRIGNDMNLFIKIIEVSTKQFKYKYEIKQVYDFIQAIGIQNNATSAFNSNQDIIHNIESRINMYTNWNEWNSKELNEWLNKKLKKIKEL